MVSTLRMRTSVSTWQWPRRTSVSSMLERIMTESWRKGLATTDHAVYCLLMFTPRPAPHFSK